MNQQMSDIQGLHAELRNVEKYRFKYNYVRVEKVYGL